MCIVRNGSEASFTISEIPSFTPLTATRITPVSYGLDANTPWENPINYLTQHALADRSSAWTYTKRAEAVHVSGKAAIWVKPCPVATYLEKTYTRGTHRLVFRLTDGLIEVRKRFRDQGSRPAPTARTGTAPGTFRSLEEAEKSAMGDCHWNPVVGVSDAAQMPPPSSCMGQTQFSFAFYSSGLVVTNSRYYKTGCVFDEKCNVTLDLDMDNHRCFLWVNDKPVDVYVSQLPNAVKVGACMSATYSKVELVEETENFRAPSVTNLRELPFNRAPALPSFSLIPSDAVYCIPSSVTTENIEYGVPGSILPCGVRWNRPANATVEQRDAYHRTLSFLQPTDPTDVPFVHRIDLTIEVPPAAGLSSSSLSYSHPPARSLLEALLLTDNTWDAFFGLTVAPRTLATKASTTESAYIYTPRPSSRRDSYAPSSDTEAPRAAFGHSSCIPLGVDWQSIAITRNGYILFNNTIVRRITPYIPRTPSLVDLSIEFSIEQKMAHFIIGKGYEQRLALIVTNLPSDFKVAVC